MDNPCTENVFFIKAHRLFFWVEGLLQRLGLFIQPMSGRGQVGQRLWKHTGNNELDAAAKVCRHQVDWAQNGGVMN